MDEEEMARDAYKRLVARDKNIFRHYRRDHPDNFARVDYAIADICTVLFDQEKRIRELEAKLATQGGE